MATGHSAPRRLFVGSRLPDSVDEKALAEHFHDVDEHIQRVEIVRDSQSRSKGFGFVTFKTATAAHEAIKRYNHSFLENVRVQVAFDKSGNHSGRERRHSSFLPDRPRASNPPSARLGHRSSVPDDRSDEQMESQLARSPKRERGRRSYQSVPSEKLTSSSSDSSIFDPLPEIAPIFSLLLPQPVSSSADTPSVVNQNEQDKAATSPHPFMKDVVNLLETCGSLQNHTFCPGRSSLEAMTCVAHFTLSSEAQEALLRLNGMLVRGHKMTVAIVGSRSVEVCILAPHVEVSNLPSSPEHNDEVQVPQAASICSMSWPASELFFQMLQEKLSHVIHEFQGHGVAISHENGRLTIRGPSQEMIQSLALIMDEFSEKTLHLPHSQWNQIMSIPPKGLSKFQEMSEPFKTNPNVTIIPVGITQKNSPPVIQFVGTAEAVKSALCCFATALNRKLELERVKIAALRELQRDLITHLSEKFQVGIEVFDSDMSFNGDPSSVCSARAEIEALSAQFQQVDLPHSSPVLSLLSSFRKKLEQHSIKACVVAVPSKRPCLCAFSSEDLQQADRISKSGLCERRMICPIENVAQRFADDLNGIEMKHSVKILVAHQQLVLRGFVQSEVDLAYEELDFLVKNVVEVRQPLKCPQSIHDYLGVLLFLKENPPQKDVDFLNSLPVEISYDQAQVMISGPISSIRSAEEKVLEYFVPSNLCHESVHFTCNEHFVSQIEKTVLKRLHAEHKFFHAISECDSESRPRTSSWATGPRRDRSYNFTVFSRNKKVLEEVCAKLKAVEPCTKTFPVSQQAIHQVENMKNQLEQRYCCRIIIRRGPQPTIAIHGLYKNETALCCSEIEGSLIVVEKVFLTGYQFQYLRENCSKKLEGMKETCKRFSLPRTHKAQDLNEKVFVLIEGKRDNVKTTATELKQLVPASKFRVETFSLTCLEVIFHLWEQKWEETADDLQKKYDIAIAFTPSPIPRQQSFDRSTIETRKKVYNFQVFGPDSEGVAEAKKMFVEQENGETKKEMILLQRNVEHRVKAALKSKKLVLSPTVRWWYEQNQLVIFAPATSATDLEAAKTDMLNFMENMTVSVEHVPCPDEVVAMVLQAQKGTLLKEVMSAAREQRVTLAIQTQPSVSIKVNGTLCGKEVVIPIIKKVLQSIADSIDSCIVEGPPLAAPFLTTEDGMQFLSKLQQRHCVVVKDAALLDTTTGNFSNVKLQEGMYSPPGCRTGIKVSIIKGNILKEAVDAVVNAANNELKHIGGLASEIAKAGGEEIQRESNAYIATHCPSGKLAVGDAVLLSPGKLPFKKIIHAVGPRWSRGSGDEKSEQLMLAFFNSLCVANNAQLSSIALPAIGTGIFSVPENVCASSALHALNNFCTSASHRTLNDVRFVLFTDTATSVFQKYFPLDQTSPTRLPLKVGLGRFFGSSKAAATSTPLFMKPISPDIVTLPSFPLSPTTSGKLFWSWKNDTGSFTPYDQNVCRQLSSSYQNNSSGSCRISIPGKPFYYTVDFRKMLQINSSTGYPREIRFQPVTTLENAGEKEEGNDEEEDEEPGEVQWLYKDESGIFTLYQPHHSAQIEGWYQSGSSGQLKINKFQYRFDFVKMVQVNTRTLRERDIQRKCSAMDAPKVTLSLRGPMNNLARASAELKKALQDSIKSEELVLRFSSKTLRGCLLRAARVHKIEVKFENSTGKTVASLKGVRTHVQTALVEMQKLVIEHMPTEADGMVQLPEEWQPQDRTMELFPLQQGSAEWREVERKFAATMGGTCIESIERVQNTWLWEKYVQHKKMMHKKNGGNVNEMELFHGTRGNDPSRIYDSEEGFDMRYSARGMWGEANYFAVNASYSDGYAHTTASGKKQLFLAKVLTGDSYHCASDHSLKMPPEKSSAGQVQLSQIRYNTVTGSTHGSQTYKCNAGQVQLSQIRYDTVTGSTQGSQVYMTYDNHKAYPAYLITYGTTYPLNYF